MKLFIHQFQYCVMFKYCSFESYECLHCVPNYGYQTCMIFKLFKKFSSLLFWDVTWHRSVISCRRLGQAVQEECLLGLLMQEMKLQRTIIHTSKNGLLHHQETYNKIWCIYSRVSVTMINLQNTGNKNTKQHQIAPIKGGGRGHKNVLLVKYKPLLTAQYPFND